MGRLPASVTRRKAGEKAQKAIIRLLKLKRELTVKELCKHLKLSHTAVRRHLESLEKEGLLDYRTDEIGIGRPIHRYRLTDKALAECFPAGYEELAQRMLTGVLDTTGHRGVFEFLEKCHAQQVESMNRQYGCLDLSERVDRLAAFFRENGYMTDWKKLKDGSFYLYHQHCAVLNLATSFRLICFFEQRLIEDLLQTSVSRKHYIFKNQPVCGYIIEKN